MSVSGVILRAGQDIKTAAGVAVGTVGGGVGTVLDVIPDNIGKLGVLVGIVLSTVLIRVHLLTIKKRQLELRILREQHAAAAADD